VSEDPMARLLADAGPRTLPPAEIQADVRRAVHQAWMEETARRARGRRRRWLAAASVLLALGAVVTAAVRLRTPPQGAAMLLASRGAVDITSDDRHRATTGGSTLGAGTHIRTGRDGMALLAVGGASLRVGPDSELSLQSADRMQLSRGRLFLDFATRAGHPQELVVRTPLGEVEHLGTQFQVRLDEGQMTVMVREGRVRVTTAVGEQLLDEHEAAEIDSSGHARVHAEPAFGTAWEWTNRLHPDFPIEGVTFAEFLDWFTHETGRPVRYASSSARAAAHNTRLSGSIAGLSPQEALTAVTASTQFVVEPLAGGELQVGLRTAAAAAPHDRLDTDGAEVLTARSTSAN
jgi:ferric-dicitrate binding protein FerR (iron transport regulator)